MYSVFGIFRFQSAAEKYIYFDSFTTNIKLVPIYKTGLPFSKTSFNKLKTVSYLIKNANKFHNVKVACFIREATFSFVSLMYCTFSKAVCHYSVTF